MATGEVPDGTMRESPYGQDATLAGHAALRALDYLADDPIWRGGTQRRWLTSDCTTFASTVACLGFLDPARYEVGQATSGRLCSFQSNIANLRAAVPFTEGERHWLEEEGHLVQHVNPVSPREFARWIRFEAREPTVYEAGRRRSVVGQNILDAWWAWRRRIFEFEGQESVDLARQALHGIGAILLPSATTRPTAK